MSLPSRSRRIAKWIGLVVCVVILGMWVVGPEYWITYSDTFVHAAIGITVGAMVLLALAGYLVGLAAYRVGLVIMVGPSRSQRIARWGLMGLCVAYWFLLAWIVIDAIPRFQSTQMALILVADTWPMGVLCLSLAVLTFCLFLRDRRDRRAVQSGHCTTCGYDLRASKERCPECGTRFAVESTPTVTADARHVQWGNVRPG